MSRSSGGPGFTDADGNLDPHVAPIGDAMNRLLKSRGLSATATLARVLEVWERAVGEDLARHVRPVAVRGSELVCEVDEPAWATQIRLLSAALLDRVAEESDERLVDLLSVRVRSHKPAG